ncbi:MAG TPA: NAD(P)H-hydrate dehydratase [Deltaproteobacteria bacterium]|nr:NAD(P)H-hydrate dehydratase [Deltaproteobacteria bacterium]
MKLASVEEMRFMDRHCIETLGIAEEILMENAALASVSLIQSETGIGGKKFVIFCGTGNNGGDGLAVARLLHSGGGRVKVFLLGDKAKFKGVARTNMAIIEKLPVEVSRLQSAAQAKKDVAHCDLIIDAIFGTGLDRPVAGLAAEVIALVNNSNRKNKKKVLSLDIPSGVNGDTGEILGAAIKADYTVTFGLPKIGNMLYPGFEQCGNLFVAHISFPLSLTENKDLKIATNDYVPLPHRSAQAHKGSVGDVLFIAGAASYYGAPYFAALSFMKSGGGYARLAAPKSMIGKLAVKGREIVYLPQEETAAKSIALKNKKKLLEAAAKVDMVVIGPGLSLDEETKQLVKELSAEIKKPMLIDGDGLTAIAENTGILQNRKAATILTPHPGEMARLTGKSKAEIDKNKIAVLREAARNLNSIIVLKGAHSLIGYPDGHVFVNLTGNAGMATAGAGDVLTGCIAAMYGLGLKPPEATRKGVFLHGLAGDLAAAKKGMDGITARDIMEYLPQALKDEREGNIADQYYTPRIII